MKICRYTPIEGSSYIESPKKIRNTHSVVNIQNEDDKCFLYSVLAALHPVENHTDRVPNYEPFLDEVKINGIKFPMRIQQIPKFEKMNNLTINVLYTTNKSGTDIWPVYISKRRGDDPINLLLLSDDEKSHYILIKNFNG